MLIQSDEGKEKKTIGDLGTEKMIFKPKFFWGILSVLFLIFDNAGAASMENDDELDVVSQPANEEFDQVAPVEATIDDGSQNSESPEVNFDAPIGDVEKRKIRIPCYCWIGWVKKKNRKYKNFGRIRRFKWHTTKKQSKCSNSCSFKCSPWLKKKAFLCRKIGKKYHYKSHKVGCFSQVGSWDWPANLWDFDGSPHDLCCKKAMKSCSSVYGSGFVYHSGMKLCVRFLASGCLPGVPNGSLTPPVCCYGNKFYGCQKPKYYGKSVTCW